MKSLHGNQTQQTMNLKPEKTIRETVGVMMMIIERILVFGEKELTMNMMLLIAKSKKS
jgi:hypothetical protein